MLTNADNKTLKCFIIETILSLLNTFYHFFHMYKNTSYDVRLVGIKRLSMKRFDSLIQGQNARAYIDLLRIFLLW